VFSCDYNGWADVPEEEREGLEAFESAQSLTATPVYLTLVFDPPLVQVQDIPQPRAA
jgi:hypothetical protein